MIEKLITAKLEAPFSVKENIKMFLLNNPTKRDLALIRLALKYNSKNIINSLVEKGVIKRFEEKSNLIANVGKNVIARLLAGDNTYTGEINYGALGTGTTPPSASDTTLETEEYRKLASSSAVDGAIVYIDFFYDKAETSGTFTEFGNFIDGTASTDSGILFSKIAVNWPKTTSDSLFVACKYTII